MPPKPRKVQSKSAAVQGAIVRWTANDTNSDESDENESLNEEESSVINNQASNLPISAASAADLLQSQELQSPSTHDAMDTSPNDNNDMNTINDALSIQQQNLLLPSNSNAGNVLGLVPQASQLINQIHSTNNPYDMDTFEPICDHMVQCI